MSTTDREWLAAIDAPARCEWAGCEFAPVETDTARLRYCPAHREELDRYVDRCTYDVVERFWRMARRGGTKRRTAREV